MDALLELLKKYVSEHSPEQCVDELADIYRRGGWQALLAEMRTDPLSTGMCVAMVMLAIVHKIADAKKGDEPVFAADPFYQKCCGLAESMEINTMQGPGSAILNIILAKLLDELVRVISEWLAEQS